MRIFIFLFLSGLSLFCQEILLQVPHRGSIISMAISPDGRLLATVCKSGTLFLWDLKEMRQMRHLETGSHWAQSVCFNKDGSLVTVGCANRLVVFRVSNGSVQFALKDLQGTVRNVAFGLDGKSLFFADYGKLRCIDVTNSKELAAREGAEFALSPNGKHIFVEKSNQGKIVEVSSWKDIASLPAAAPYVFDPASNILVIPERDASFASGGRKASVVNLKGDRICSFDVGSEIHALAVSPDSRMVAASAEFRTENEEGDVRTYCGIFFVDAATGKLIKRLKIQNASRGSIGMSVDAITFTPDGSRLLCGSADGVIVAVDSSRMEIERTIPRPAGGLKSSVFSNDGTKFVSIQFSSWGDEAEYVNLWDLAGAETKTVTLCRDRGKFSKALIFSHDSKAAVIGDSSGMTIYNTSTGELDRKVPAGSSGYVTLSRDSESLLVTMGGWNAKKGGAYQKLVDLSTGKEIGRVMGVQEGSDLSIEMGVNGELAFLIDKYDSKTVQAVELVGGKLRYEIRTGENSISNLSMDRAGKFIAVGMNEFKNPEIKIYDYSSGKPVSTFAGYGPFRFSPDGSFGACRAKQSAIAFVETSSGKEIAKVDGDFAYNGAASFLANNKVVAIDLFGGSILFYSLEQRKELGRLRLIGEKEWIVVSATGAFDCSPESLDRLPVGAESKRVKNLLSKLVRGETK